MGDKKRFSKTMRIDLIPDVPVEPEAGAMQRVVVSALGSAPSDRPVPGGEGQSPYRQLLERLYDGAVVTDLGGTIVDVNVRAAEFLGCDPGELHGVSILEFLSGADEGLLETVSENLEAERFTLIQAYCQRRDGTFFPSEISVSRLQLDQPLLCFFLRDITLRRQAEEMLLTEHNALQNAGTGIAVADIDARLEYVNPVAALMWGYDGPDEMVGMDVRELLVDQALAGEMTRRVIDERGAWAGDGEAAAKGGKAFAVQIAVACNRNSDGEVVGMVFSFVNVSDRKRAEAAEREAERQRVMLESLGAACHHLSQPATVLSSNLGILKSRLHGESDPLGELVQASIEAVHRLGEILHRLHAVTEYKTTSYLSRSESEGSDEHRILDI